MTNREVFGGKGSFSPDWLIPTKPVYIDRDDIYGYRRECLDAVVIGDRGIRTCTIRLTVFSETRPYRILYFWSIVMMLPFWFSARLKWTSKSRGFFSTFLHSTVPSRTSPQQHHILSRK